LDRPCSFLRSTVFPIFQGMRVSCFHMLRNLALMKICIPFPHEIASQLFGAQNDDEIHASHAALGMMIQSAALLGREQQEHGSMYSTLDSGTIITVFLDLFLDSILRGFNSMPQAKRVLGCRE
jgi:hypothetical protein